jgi:hypothetical protein
MIDRSDQSTLQEDVGPLSEKRLMKFVMPWVAVGANIFVLKSVLG